jgi:hypothetical protein
MDAKSEADRLIGIDVSKARVDAHVQPDGTAFLLHDRYRGLGRAGQAGAQLRRRHWPVGQNRCDQSLSSGRPTAGPVGRGDRPLRPGGAPGGAAAARWRLRGQGSYSSISSLRATVGYWGVPTIQARFETTYFAGLREAGMPEE